MAGSARCVPRFREGRPGMKRFLNPINNVRHGEERRRRVSNRTRRPCRTRLSFRDQFFTRSFAGATRKKNQEPSVWFIKAASQDVSGAAWLPLLAG